MFKSIGKLLRRYRKLLLSLVAAVALAFYFSLPDPLFNEPLSTLVVSAEGEWLAARIASDGQWRFPPGGPVPEKFETCLLAFEDRHFYQHLGVNPVSISKALIRNVSKRRIVNGGSTITMQVIRLSRKGKARTYAEKFIEIWLALRLECSYSKQEILAMYANYAPFGGNVVGIEAAARRYFNRPPAQLSWAESATLAVLPNAPALIFPGRNQQALLNKRNRLLNYLHLSGKLDATELNLALSEPLPGKPEKLPQLGLHLLDKLSQEYGEGNFFKTPVQSELQSGIHTILNQYTPFWEANGVYNAAVMVVDATNGSVLAYVGNISKQMQLYGRSNNMLSSRRSTGSILKPFLYAAMLQDGIICPRSLQPDIPTRLGAYSPRNYDLQYSGAVPADMALARSLNVPAVRMLQTFGLGRFHSLLKNTGMSTLNQSPSHYGLSLILGGAETTAEDLCRMYLRFVRALSGKENLPAGNLHFCEQDAMQTMAGVRLPEAAVAYETFEAMSRVNRPDAQAGWQEFLSSRKIAWKTGTSFGHRDAWALGVTPQYIVCTWVGNASGEGKPILSGLQAAAPVLFEVFSLLPGKAWFSTPLQNQTEQAICSISGDKAGPFCTDSRLERIPKTCMNAPVCKYHKRIFVHRKTGLRAETGCAAMADLLDTNYFVLPPLMEHYYKLKHPGYSVLPAWSAGCSGLGNETVMQFIYPQANIKIALPRDIRGKRTSLVVKLAHRNPGKQVFWYLNQEQVAITREIHETTIDPGLGLHSLLAIDEDGNQIRRKFTIVEK